MVTENWNQHAAVKGVALGVAAAGIKTADRHDLGVLLIEDGASVAGVFTQNAFAAAPVGLCKKHLAAGEHIRALVVNSGNANACTGVAGEQAAQRTCEAAGGIIGASARQILPFSTGVIGETLPIGKLTAALPAACASAAENGWRAFAEAIMTTDTRPKGASTTLQWQGRSIAVSGVAKGAGMIRPNMATMLAFIATDAAISAELLRQLAKTAADKSFNRITIDGDTSTNDACILVATGKAGTEAVDSADSPLLAPLAAAIDEVCQSLAKQIVRDGEGATKFVEIDVRGGASPREALNVAYAVAHSPLVKTAVFAADPNWGRIVAAIGYADVADLVAAKVSVWLDDVLIVENGGKAATYREAQGQRVFDREAFTIRIDLGRGDAREKLWTSDLSHEYVRINAEYRS